MSVFGMVLMVLVCFGCGYYVVSTLALVRHFQKKQDISLVSPPAKVSVLKPVCGVDADAVGNLTSFLKQDYTDYEVLYGVLEEEDPAYGLVQDLIRGTPRASLYAGSEIVGANNKVKILHTLASYSAGDVLVIADADTRVEGNCVSRVCAPFSDPSVGVVTCMYRGTAAKSVADMMEGLHMTCVFEPGVACAEYLGQDFGLGALIAVRRSALECIGGFSSLVDYLADDYELAHRVAQTGRRIVLSEYVVDIVLSGESMKSVMLRLLRWAQTLRVCNPKGYLGLGFTYGVAWSVMFCLATGLSHVGLAVGLGTVILRVVSAYVGARRCLGDREFLKRAVLLPVCDIVEFFLWMGAMLARSVHWRGRRLRVSRDGRMVPLKR